MGMNVLIAEDNEYTQLQYKIILEKHGHNVTVANDGAECLALYNEGIGKSNSESNPFDVVLIDNNMPNLTGVEVAQKILNQRPNQRILFASAYDINSVPEVTEQVINTVEVLQKPFPLKQVLNSIEN